MTVDLAANAQAVPAARKLLRQLLAAWSHTRLLDDASIVLSELVTNAVQHAHGTLNLHLGLHGDSDGALQIAVEDSSNLLPVVKAVPIDSEAGRGMRLVQRLSVRWGVEIRPDGGKLVWAELH